MKSRYAMLMAAMSMGLASCGGDATPSPDNRAASMGSGAPGRPPLAQVGPRQTVSTPSPNRKTGADAPPAEAQFMIFCDVIRGPGHEQRVMQLKQKMVAETHRNDWNVIHSADESSLYLGYYRTFDDFNRDPQEAARAQADRRFVETRLDGLGERLFKNSMFVPVNSPDPDAPPEWNLVNTPSDAFWSVQIAAYQGSPERKKAAVESVKQMRQQGIKAYYFHGETISSVCIGAWPRSAIKEQHSDDAHSIDPSQPILVMPEYDKNIGPVAYKDGQKVLMMAPKVEVEDADLKKTLKDYPYHAINGEWMGKQVNGQLVRDPSLLVQIPAHEQPGSVASGGPVDQDPGPAVSPDAVRSGADDAAAAILGHSSPQSPQQQPAKLRSIGDR